MKNFKLDIPKTSLGDKIKELREEKRISIRGLGRLTKVSGMHICNLERNLTNASPKLLTKIAEALDVDINYLFSLAKKSGKNPYDRKYHLIVKSRRESYILDKTGGTCELCKEHWPSDILCFHHLNPEDKEFDLPARKWSNKNLDNALREADKCAILCMNCHALEHKALNRGETLLNDEEAYSRYRNKRFSGEPSVDDRNERPSDTEQEGICIPF